MGGGDGTTASHKCDHHARLSGRHALAARWAVDKNGVGQPRATKAIKRAHDVNNNALTLRGVGGVWMQGHPLGIGGGAEEGSVADLRHPRDHFLFMTSPGAPMAS